MSDGDWLTPRQVADMLKVSIDTVRARIGDGTLKAYRVRRSRLLRIKRADLDALLEEVPHKIEQATSRLEVVR